MIDWKKALVIFSILSSIKQDRTLEAACPRLVFTSCCQIIAIGGGSYPRRASKVRAYMYILRYVQGEGGGSNLAYPG